MSDQIAQQATEYGYRTPNGEEYFFSETVNPRRGPGVGFEDLDTPRGQARAQGRYKNILRAQGIPEEGNELEFIQRVRTVTLSASIPLVAKVEDEDEDDKLRDF